MKRIPKRLVAKAGEDAGEVEVWVRYLATGEGAGCWRGCWGRGRGFQPPGSLGSVALRHT